MPALPIDTDQIVITASRVPESRSPNAASVTIIDSNEIERLDEPLVANLLRLTPSAAVTSIGPAGSLTEVRIRGSEANHTLLFVDGIKINDPASGDAPRFELLNADLASRIEVVRGPQSALWGSDAIGGVIAVNGLDDAPGYAASGEGRIVRFCAGQRVGCAHERQHQLVGARRLAARHRHRQLRRSRRRQGRLQQPVGTAAWHGRVLGSRVRLGVSADLR